jgi:hypothetical protein
MSELDKMAVYSYVYVYDYNRLASSLLISPTVQLTKTMELCHIGKQIFIEPPKKLFAFCGIRWSLTLSSIIAKFELTCQ